MIIVTGSNGFIGSNLIKGLNEMGIKEIIAVDDQTNTETHRNIAHLEIEEFFEIDEFLDFIRADFGVSKMVKLATHHPKMIVRQLFNMVKGA